MRTQALRAPMQADWFKMNHTIGLAFSLAQGKQVKYEKYSRVKAVTSIWLPSIIPLSEPLTFYRIAVIGGSYIPSHYFLIDSQANRAIKVISGPQKLTKNSVYNIRVCEICAALWLAAEYTHFERSSAYETLRPFIFNEHFGKSIFDVLP